MSFDAPAVLQTGFELIEWPAAGGGVDGGDVRVDSVLGPFVWGHELQAGAPDVAAISVAGQQHGMVVLDEAHCVVRPAKLWNDTESAPDAAWLIDQLPGGNAAWADALVSAWPSENSLPMSVAALAFANVCDAAGTAV